MRISDWSSDVCSSDLAQRHHVVGCEHRVRPRRGGLQLAASAVAGGLVEVALQDPRPCVGQARGQLVAVAAQALGGVEVVAGAGDRKSGVEGKSVSVRVDLGGRRIINKKRNTIDTVQWT